MPSVRVAPKLKCGKGLPWASTSLSLNGGWGAGADKRPVPRRRPGQFCQASGAPFRAWEAIAPQPSIVHSNWTPTFAGERPVIRLRFLPTLFGAIGGILDPRLDLAVQLQGQRAAMAVDLLAQRNANPAFGNAIFLDIAAFIALEADADPTREEVLVEIGAVRVGGQAIGNGIGHVAGLNADSGALPSSRHKKNGAGIAPDAARPVSYRPVPARCGPNRGPNASPDSNAARSCDTHRSPPAAGWRRIIGVIAAVVIIAAIDIAWLVAARDGSAHAQPRMPPINAPATASPPRSR